MMKRLLFVVIGLVFVLGLICFSNSASAADTVVSPDQDPSWYDATHVLTVQEGIDNATSGATIRVWAGTYTENIVNYIAMTMIGNSSSNTTINGEVSLYETYTNFSGFRVNTDGIYMRQNRFFINIRNCTVSNATTGIQVIDGREWAANITIENCLIENCGTGISGDIDYCNIKNITLLNITNYAIKINDASHNWIITNTSMNDSQYGVYIDAAQVVDPPSFVYKTFDCDPGAPVDYYTTHGCGGDASENQYIFFETNYDIYGANISSDFVYYHDSSNVMELKWYDGDYDEYQGYNYFVNKFNPPDYYTEYITYDPPLTTGLSGFKLQNWNFLHTDVTEWTNCFGELKMKKHVELTGGVTGIQIVDCSISNCTTNGLYTEGTVNSIFIKNTTFINNTDAIDCDLATNSDYLNINNNTFNNNSGEAIIISRPYGVTIFNNTFYGKGIRFPITGGTNTIAGNVFQVGIDNEWAMNTGGANLIYSNYFIEMDLGISFADIPSGLVYNNYFNCTTNICENDFAQIWNISKTFGANIIGGSYIGGNYWNDYEGVDTDRDGFGNTNTPHTNSGNILNGGDYLPLISSIMIADFSYTPNNPQPGEEITFKDKSTGTITSWHWYFRDGYTAVGKNQKHIFDEPGNYRVKLEVSDGTNRDSVEKIIDVRYADKDWSIVYPEDPRYPTDPYTVEEIYKILRVDKVPKSDNVITIVFLDTGYTPRMYNGVDLSDISGYKHPAYSSAIDEQGHGTWISYTLGYLKQWKLNNINIISFKVFDDRGQCTVGQLIESLDMIKNMHPDIVSFSGGAIMASNNPVEQKVNELRDSGIIMMCAAGNYGPGSSTIVSPGSSGSAFAVGATDPFRTLNFADDVICSWSSRGPVSDASPKPDVASPGESILGPWLHGDRVVSGTSMSTPFIAGGTAIIYANNQDILGWVDTLYFWDNEIKANLIEDSIGESCYDKGDENSYGYGIPDFEKANSILFWKCVTMILLFIIILVVIIVSVVYYWFFYRKDAKKHLH